MTELDMYDLHSYKHLLIDKIRLTYPNFLECIFEHVENDNTICSCGCNNTAICTIIFIMSSTPKNKKYGLLLYPNKTCIPTILNIDNRGYIIKTQLYDYVCEWLKNIPRSEERQIERTNKLKFDILTKYFSKENLEYDVP